MCDQMLYKSGVGAAHHPLFTIHYSLFSIHYSLKIFDFPLPRIVLIRDFLRFNLRIRRAEEIVALEPFVIGHQHIARL